MKNRILALALTLLLLLTVLAGCGGDAKIESPGGYKNEVLGDAGVTEESGALAERKVIITARYSVETEDIRGAMQAIEQAVQAGDGYVEQADVSGREENTYAEYTLRVPVEQLGQLATTLEKVGEITFSSREQEDVTEQYQDVQAKIQARTAQRDRLLELIDKAETLSDLLQLEEEFAQVQGELDSLIGRQKLYDSKITYATVSVSLTRSTAAAVTATPYGKRLLNALEDSFSTALGFVQFLGVALVWLLPLILVAAVVLTVVLLATRKSRRARKQSKQPPKE